MLSVHDPNSAKHKGMLSVCTNIHELLPGNLQWVWYSICTVITNGLTKVMHRFAWKPNLTVLVAREKLLINFH